MKTQNSISVAIYSRVSTDKQDSENQLAQLREFAARQHWQISTEYIDQGVSGSKAGSTRPEFARMMQDASQKKFDLLLFWSLDRLSREGVSQTLAYLNQFDSWKIGFKSFTEQYLDSLGLFKDAILALLATLAKQERIRISERTKAGLQAAKRRGVKLGRQPISNELASRIRSIRATGIGVRETARQLNVSHTLVSRLSRALPDMVEIQPLSKAA
jgi:DNA invertase Pin-like site-specific DNA recombinase